MFVDFEAKKSWKLFPLKNHTQSVKEHGDATHIQLCLIGSSSGKSRGGAAVAVRGCTVTESAPQSNRHPH